MPAVTRELREALERHPLLLDGATGTELERRGNACPPPLWSASALITQPDAVAAIHRDYVSAGADILVANTFRTNPRSLRAAGHIADGERLNRLAIELARGAAATANRRVFVAASVAPMEDCYSPECVPDEETLREEHAQMIEWLRPVAPDLVWIETMNSIGEARAAAEAAAIADLPFTVSFVVRESGNLLSDESLADAVAAVEPFDPLAVGVNCIPPRAVADFLRRLTDVTNRPLLAYAHINNASPIRGWSYAQSVSLSEYAECARQWSEAGAGIVGGCCGTTPDHSRAIREILDGNR